LFQGYENGEFFGFHASLKWMDQTYPLGKFITETYHPEVVNVCRIPTKYAQRWDKENGGIREERKKLE
jgi:hypothetical protein